VLLLVRHCEATGNANGLLLGRTDSPLTERGEGSAPGLRTLIDREGPVARVISSPLVRAMRTAEMLELGPRIEVDERWTEVDYGRYEGEKLTDLPSEVWRQWRSDPHFRPPGGETLAELGDRVRLACDELFGSEGLGSDGLGADGLGARDPDRHVVVVSHVSPIKAAVAWALGAPDAIAWRLWLANASLSVVGWRAGNPVLHRYNIVSPADGDRDS
jgi:probable phosphoglycerate mutase